MQWRMVGRRGRDRVVDDRRRPGAVVVAGAGRGGGRPGRGARGQGAARVPPVDQLPQLRGDLRLRRGVRRRGSASTSTCPTAVRSTGVEPVERDRGRRPGGRDPGGRRRARRAGRAAPSASSSRSPGARRSTPGWRRWPELAADAPGARAAVDSSVRPRARTGSSCSPASTPRAWSSTASSSCCPEEIEAESATGRATLYVVLTRATQLLPPSRRMPHCGISPWMPQMWHLGAVGRGLRRPGRRRVAMPELPTALDRRCRVACRGRAGRTGGHEAWAVIRLRDSATVTLVGGSRSEVARLLDVPLEEGVPAAGPSVRPAARDPVPAGARARLRGPRRRRPAGRRRHRDRARGPGRRAARRAARRARSSSPTAAASRPPTRTTRKLVERDHRATRSARARAPTWSSAATTAPRSPTGTPTGR